MCEYVKGDIRRCEQSFYRKNGRGADTLENTIFIHSGIWSSLITDMIHILRGNSVFKLTFHIRRLNIQIILLIEYRYLQTASVALIIGFKLLKFAWFSVSNKQKEHYVKIVTAGSKNSSRELKLSPSNSNTWHEPLYSNVRMARTNKRWPHQGMPHALAHLHLDET